jgi:hypothetical protein
MTIPSKLLFLEVMQEALGGPAVRLELGSQAVKLRQRFYRIRQRCWEEGDVRFAFLRFRIRGSLLIIDRHPDSEAIRHRIRLRALREMFAFAREYRASLERPTGEDARTGNSVEMKEQRGDVN